MVLAKKTDTISSTCAEPTYGKDNENVAAIYRIGTTHSLFRTGRS